MPEAGEQNTTATTETAIAATDGAQQDTSATDAHEEQLGEGGRKALEAERASRKALEKQLQTMQREIEKTRQAGMSEAEKAIAEAEVKGRTAATAEFGKRLAKAALDTAAARRNPDFDTAALEYVDLSRFVGDDGEPDAKAIAAAVERLVPTASGAAPGFDGGTRTSTPKGADMNSLLRQAAGRA